MLRTCAPKTLNSSSTPSQPIVALVSSRCASSSVHHRKHRHDPYALEAARQRKAANIARQNVLREERTQALGDPVIGKSTPFVQSLLPGRIPQAVEGDEAQTPYNFFLTQQELDESLQRSEYLSRPVPAPNDAERDVYEESQQLAQHREQDQNAREALRRITQLSTGNNKDRTRVNVQRCIQTFGRHKTDAYLPPKPASTMVNSNANPEAIVPRAGPDTGSSEVQIAILTTKIMKLASQLVSTGHKDKHNKRNLRLLVHRRQRLLKYLHRRERGGPRWQNLMRSLGLTDAAWKGEISM